MAMPSFSDRKRRISGHSRAHHDQCKVDFDCGSGASCVTMGRTRRCVCVEDLTPPDPVTGDCDTFVPEINFDDVAIPRDRLMDTMFPNVTSNRIERTKEASHTLDAQLFTFVPLVFAIAAIAAIFLILCRRHTKKKLCASRNRASAPRRTDGELLLDRMSNVNKNQTYLQTPAIVPRQQSVKEIDVTNLKILERIGEGAFGQVFKGDLYCPIINDHTLVAVKILKEDANVEAKSEFEKEVEIMSVFDHDNILSLRGIVMHGVGDVPLMVFDYMEHGDLSDILRSSDVHHGRPGKLQLSKTDRVDISVQIASGMNYLSGQRFVHRDLAARNCLVGKGLVVKISDFGMARDVYTQDYYKLGGSRMLPVRWMSPEAVKFGSFTTESDIWAYGVVLWEIFSGGRQPYYGHGNEEVINLLDQGILLQKLEECPSTVYHVMLGCWKQDPKERTPFDRLGKHMTDYRDQLIQNAHP